jgi:hypothetical protein
MGAANESTFVIFNAEIRVIFNIWHDCTAVSKETCKSFTLQYVVEEFRTHTRSSLTNSILLPTMTYFPLGSKQPTREKC